MKKSATMFLNQISVVDHAYVDNEGKIVGGSFNPDFIVSGEVDPVEQVVVDFSTVKKDLKGLIDHKTTGFDHKLWVMNGYSKCTVEPVMMYGLPYFKITSPAFTVTVPVDAVKIFDCDDYSTTAVGAAFASYLQTHMQEKYPTIKIECHNTIIAHTPSVVHPSSAPAMFTYVHGLKDSTSWGCQNNSHGHLSFIQSDSTLPEALTLQQRIADDLNGVIFIMSDNVSGANEGSISIEYTTERGRFTATYNTTAQKVIVLNTETTIEHLVDYIAGRYETELQQLGIKRIFVSEGLSKGAVAFIPKA